MGTLIALSDYVLEQPPHYTGPSRPVDPSKPQEPPPERESIPVVADFLRNAKEHFGFVPERPDSEMAYKRAYARIASAAGISRDQAVRIYSFESGGNGKYDVQAGLESARPQCSRDLDRAWLQPASHRQHHQHPGGEGRAPGQGDAWQGGVQRQRRPEKGA